MQVRTVTARRSFAGIDSFAVLSEEEPRRIDLGRLRPGAMMRGLLWASAALFVLAGLVNLVVVASRARMADAAAVEATLPAVPKPQWIEVNRPIQLFALGGTALSKLPLAYRARRRTDRDERQDTLTFGQFGEAGPYLALTLSRAAPAAVPPTDRTLFVDLARLAADAMLAVTRSGQPTPLPTRFGPFETADITLAGGDATMACLGFRLQGDTMPTAPVGIAGFACGAPGKPLDRQTLGCALDRIDLVSAGDDATMRDFFVAAEQRRGQGCGGLRMLSTGTRASWLDADAQPPSLRRLAGHARTQQ